MRLNRNRHLPSPPIANADQAIAFGLKELNAVEHMAAAEKQAGFEVPWTMDAYPVKETKGYFWVVRVDSRKLFPSFSCAVAFNSAGERIKMEIEYDASKGIYYNKPCSYNK